MKVFQILKVLAQLLGVFPFKEKKIFYISKLYLFTNIFIGSCLVVIAGINVKYIYEPSTATIDVLSLTINTFMKTILLGRVIASLSALVSKFIWRREHLENLNAILEFFQEHRLSSILNSTKISDYFFIATLCISVMNEISVPILDVLCDNTTLHSVCNSVIEFPMIMDEIMFCVACSAMSKSQQQIKQMILSCKMVEETEEFVTNNRNISQIGAGDFLQNQLQQVKVFERPVRGSYRRSVSSRAQKLECFRKMNLKIFNIYSNYSALHQYQLFISTTLSTIEVTYVIFAVFAAVTQNLRLDSRFFTYQCIKMFGHLVSNLIRIFMICHYNDKAFNEGISIKYIIQDIRSASNEKDMIKVLTMFMEQLHKREQFQICGLFAFNMTLPVAFVGSAINYVVVLVQYLDLKV